MVPADIILDISPIQLAFTHWKIDWREKHFTSVFKYTSKLNDKLIMKFN